MPASEPARWNQPDLARRVAAALGIAGQALQAAPVPVAGPTAEVAHGDGQLAGVKVAAEGAMLLFCAAPVQHLDARIRDGVDLVARLLIPHARNDSVLAAICMDPALARDHSVAHVILSHLGYPDPDADRLLRQSLSAGPDLGPERLPHRELEQRWHERIHRAGGAPPRSDAQTLAHSSLGRRMDALGSTLLDRYAFTHCVLYASDLGGRRVALPRPAADIAADADAALAASLDADDFDLTAEILWTWPMLGLAWSPAATFAFQVLAAAEDQAGFLPGPDFSAAKLRSLPTDRRARYKLVTSYHTALVMGFLCAAALRPGRTPPAAVPDSSTTPSAAADLMRLIPPQAPEPRWREAFRSLALPRQNSLVPLVLTIILRRARSQASMTLLRDALQIALDHDLLDEPALVQALALLRRAAALGGRPASHAPSAPEGRLQAAGPGDR
jgi:hypothetical protein